MKITISGVHLEITSAISDYVQDKCESATKYLKHDQSASLAVEITKTTAHHAHGDIYEVSALLTKKGRDTALSVTADDVYKGIDLLKDKLSRELSDEKDRELSLFKKGAKRIKSLLKGGTE